MIVGAEGVTKPAEIIYLIAWSTDIESFVHLDKGTNIRKPVVGFGVDGINTLIIFLFFIYRVFKKIYSEKNEKVKLILTGSITLILCQTLIHLGVNIRLFPTTGMTLPYLSYGGSSIIGVSILSGIILNLTKRKII